VVVQVIVTLACGLVPDPTFARLFGIALVAYWVGVVLIISRRPISPSPFDLWFVRLGFLAVSIISVAMTPLIWRLRGFF
jgi:hypothetical protein